VHGKTSTDYFAFHINPPIEFSLGIIIEYLETTIFIADAKNNIVFYTDNNMLYIKPNNGTKNPVDKNM
jgi:hypothetical protein